MKIMLFVKLSVENGLNYQRLMKNVLTKFVRSMISPHSESPNYTVILLFFFFNKNWKYVWNKCLSLSIITDPFFSKCHHCHVLKFLVATLCAILCQNCFVANTEKSWIPREFNPAHAAPAKLRPYLVNTRRRFVQSKNVFVSNYLYEKLQIVKKKL